MTTWKPYTITDGEAEQLTTDVQQMTSYLLLVECNPEFYEESGIPLDRVKLTDYRILRRNFSRADINVITKYLKEMPYELFLRTPYWKSIAETTKRLDKFTCQECGKKSKYLNAHHKTYEHRGEEIEYLCDLTSLCKDCHKKTHQLL